MAGRRPKYAERMKPNGLPVELDNWFLAEGKRLYGKGGGARLKREVLEAYRTNMQRPIGMAETEIEVATAIYAPQTLVAGE